MAKTTKPTKQQIAQAKTRAGGNNPVKVTNAGLKKLGNAALIAATFTPVGRVAKVAATAAKPIAAAARNAAGKKVVSATMGKAAAKKYTTAAAKRTAQRTQTAADLKNAKIFATPRSGISIKPAAKQPVVKRVARKTAPKTDLSNRGAKPTTRERINRARDLQWDKAERSYDAGNEMRYTGLVSSDKGMVAARGAGKKNMRKRDAIRREANKKLPVQINSANSSTSRTSGNMFRGTDSLKANNARALKAANKPVSKNNRNRFGDGEMSAYLKSAKPARANRARAGKSANKK